MPIVRRLPHRLGIMVPSRDRHGHPVPKAVRAEIERVVAEWFSKAFGGSTEERVGHRDRLIGRFEVKPGKVVVETVKEVWAQCTRREFERHRLRLARLAEWVCSHGDQAVVAITVDREMRLVAAAPGGSIGPI